MKTTVDYIIVGQGLAGSALAWTLLQRGRRVMVYDQPENNRASRIAAGICNPVTGRVMTKTFLAEELFPFLNRFYQKAEEILGRKFFYPLPIYRPFLSQEEVDQWKNKLESGELSQFVTIQKEPSGTTLNDQFGGLEIKQSGYLNVAEWTTAVRDLLKERRLYKEEKFIESELEPGEVVRYREHVAKKIIFCQGTAALQNSFFNWLPLKPLKGETITVKMNFDPTRIISRGVYVVPSREQNEFIVGSTYERMPFEEGLSEVGKEQIMSGLRALVKEPFQLVHQDWGIRPTVSDRRPLLGGHPDHRNVVIFNGLGTKGVSLAPYFAECLSDWMEGMRELPEEVNIYRFKSLYSK
jgi:glycine/D-amino acid oxidase-like deaminating enzyme